MWAEFNGISPPDVQSISLQLSSLVMSVYTQDYPRLFNDTLQIYRVICARENGCEPEVRTQLWRLLY